MDLKDHFEHLRTVHFSLIATCLLLLVVSTTSQNLTVKLAENQLSSMQSMVGHWSDLDFDAAIDRQVQASSMQVPRSRVLKFVNPVFVPKPGLYAIDFTMPAWVPITTEQCTPWLYDPMLKRQPRTLADAHEVWDCQGRMAAECQAAPRSGEDSASVYAPECKRKSQCAWLSWAS